MITLTNGQTTQEGTVIYGTMRIGANAIEWYNVSDKRRLAVMGEL